MKSFEKTLEVRWSDCDPNRHVTHSKYYDYGAHCRVSFFIESGFNSEKMAELQIGPILFKEECTFIKELKIQDTVRVNILKGEISEDGGRWTVHHEIFNQKGDKCAHITAKGAWMNLELRKLTLPPAELTAAFQSLPSGEYYEYKSKKLG
jgi:acyl-CoA thioester hydrolase